MQWMERYRWLKKKNNLSIWNKKYWPSNRYSKSFTRSSTGTNTLRLQTFGLEHTQERITGSKRPLKKRRKNFFQNFFANFCSYNYIKYQVIFDICVVKMNKENIKIICLSICFNRKKKDIRNSKIKLPHFHPPP